MRGNIVSITPNILIIAVHLISYVFRSDAPSDPS